MFKRIRASGAPTVLKSTGLPLNCSHRTPRSEIDDGISTLAYRALPLIRRPRTRPITPRHRPYRKREQRRAHGAWSSRRHGPTACPGRHPGCPTGGGVSATVAPPQSSRTERNLQPPLVASAIGTSMPPIPTACRFRVDRSAAAHTARQLASHTFTTPLAETVTATPHTCSHRQSPPQPGGRSTS